MQSLNPLLLKFEDIIESNRDVSNLTQYNWSFGHIFNKCMKNAAGKIVNTRKQNIDAAYKTMKLLGEYSN